MSTVWELDFYSRPILDEQQKKIWELLICNTERTFEYTKCCSGAEANARWLQTSLKEAIFLGREAGNLQGQEVPEKIRFFRPQMNNIITRACAELGIPAQPSRRTFALCQWLQQRVQTVYPNHPGFQPLTALPFQFEQQKPQPLPDVLIGQGWMFATLEARAFEEMEQWEIAFGEVFPLSLMNLASEAQIPGLIIFSPRAIPLAGWMSGLELAFLKLESCSPVRLLLATGASDRWIIANLKDPQMVAEAQEFEAAKQQVQQVHFLAVQSDPQTESFAGFWLLQETNLS
jgi:hypothetical protein